MIFVVNSTMQVVISFRRKIQWTHRNIQDPFTDNFPFKLERIKEIFPTFENLL